MFAIVDRSRHRDSLSARARLCAAVAGVAAVAAVGTLRLTAARTQSFMPSTTPMQASGPGAPAFEWTREVDEETRRRVASALEAATNRDSDAQVRVVADRALKTIQSMPEGTVLVSSPCRGNCLLGSQDLPAPAAVLFEVQTQMALFQLLSRVETARREAVTRLPPRFGTALEVLADLLRDPDPQVRRLAAVRLDSVTFPPAVPGWVALLVDDDDSLRERAAISLGAIGDPIAIDALASVLLNDPNSDVRRQAARSLGLIAAGN